LPVIVIVTACFAGTASAALADSVTSSNWAGYAVHHSGVQFKKATASWIQPTATCTPGTPTYSAIWVGLGGYNVNSSALEQIGSEVDCRANGTIASSVWYELVPAPSRTIRMQVHPGDGLAATVTVHGTTVLLRLSDLTTHRTFTKTLHASALDLTSAEWIVEAPSDCASATTCQTLPLANFGSTAFDFATAQSLAGHTGTVSDRKWDVSKIQLTADGRRFIGGGGGAPPVGIANPSPLTHRGASFNVTYAADAPPSPPYMADRAATLQAGHLVHPRRA
jgi:hypothetical protein